jgi:hypothetical protein
MLNNTVWLIVRVIRFLKARLLSIPPHSSFGERERSVMILALDSKFESSSGHQAFVRDVLMKNTFGCFEIVMS